MEQNEEQLELVEFRLDDIWGDLEAVSIVTDPAIEQSFQLFSKVKKQMFITNQEKQEITGPVMIPNIPILRVTDEGKYYNCYFSEKTVKDCAYTWLKNCNHTSANFEHLGNSFTDKICAIESWIVENPELDKSKALGFKDVGKGAWFLTYKVEDKGIWDSIKKHGFTGFSIEGYFDTFAKMLKEKEVLNKIKSVLDSKLSDEDKEMLIKKYIS